MKTSEIIKDLRIQLYAVKEDARLMADLLMLLNGMDVVDQYAGEKEWEAIERWRTKQHFMSILMSMYPTERIK